MLLGMFDRGSTSVAGFLTSYLSCVFICLSADGSRCIWSH